jgi:hypothetical protein
VYFTIAFVTCCLSVCVEHSQFSAHFGPNLRQFCNAIPICSTLSSRPRIESCTAASFSLLVGRKNEHCYSKYSQKLRLVKHLNLFFNYVWLFRDRLALTSRTFSPTKLSHYTVERCAKAVADTWNTRTKMLFKKTWSFTIFYYFVLLKKISKSLVNVANIQPAAENVI